jgi:hypothetical protein
VIVDFIVINVCGIKGRGFEKLMKKGKKLKENK